MAAGEPFDVIIVGGAAAGLAAAIYTARDRYRTVILEKNPLPGGQILMTRKVANFPGHEDITGPELIQSMQRQAEAFGAEILTGQNVQRLGRLEDGLLEVQTDSRTFCSRAVILAPGSRHRQLGVPGEREMREAGRVSYCAVCDGPFYHQKDVLVVGGGNTALEDAIYLATQFTRHLTLIHRRREFRAEKILVEQLFETCRTAAVDVKLPCVLKEIVAGDDVIDHVVLENVESRETESLQVDGIFILVGTVPNTEFLNGTVDMDHAGYILCDPLTLHTSLPGVFVAGDCRSGAAMQLATACADGVVAALGFKHYLRNPEAWTETITQGVWGY
jgi:thioredoxin reductase (NADPH)